MPKHRTHVRGHERRKPNGGKAKVRGHIREFETRGQVRRKHERRSKRAIATDEAKRAEGARPFAFKKNRKNWQKDPASTDISGVDT